MLEEINLKEYQARMCFFFFKHRIMELKKLFERGGKMKLANQ